MAVKRRPPPAAQSAYVELAFDYARRVIAGEVPACQLVVRACERFENDLKLANAGLSEWEFSPVLADKAMTFVGLMPNIKGEEAGKPLRIMPWQAFAYANLFGFVERGTTTRRFRQGVIFVPRGNGKTTIAAPAALYMTFAENEGGAEGYAAAVTRDQARILFDMALNMTRRSARFRSLFHVDFGANAIYQERSASKLIPISSDAKALDGLNVQVAVCDEIASHKTSEVYDVLLTAMGKRRHPLLISISTATDNQTGIGRQLWDYVRRLLDGDQQDDRLFGMIYTIDDTDDPWAEETWIKANPGWGITVQPNAVRAIMGQARNNPATEAAVMTKHLNVWIGANDALYSTRAWRECKREGLRLADMKGQECHLGLDLASKVDLASLGLVFPARHTDMQLRYKIFSQNYLNSAAVMEARNAAYPGWAAAGHLAITDGNETDFQRIEDDLLEFCRQFRVVSVGYDPWAATQFAQRMIAQGVPMVEFRANTQSFSEPTKELDAAMRAGRIEHDGNPVLEWCISNVVGHYDARANVYPRKARPENKIDAAIATIMGIARSMASQPARSIYESRGIAFV